MFSWLGRQYSRRVVNVNVNILLAGLLALAPTLLVVRLMEKLLRTGAVSGAKLHIGDKAIITGTTLVADIVFDVSIYFGLHWLANHWGRSERAKKQQHHMEVIADAAVETVPFFKDASKVQFERMVLSPLLYALFLGTQFSLMTLFKVPPVPATALGFLVGIATARTLHTLWMLREERRMRARAVANGAARPGSSSAAA